MRWPAAILLATCAAAACLPAAHAQSSRLATSIVQATRPLTAEESKALSDFIDRNVAKLSSDSHEDVRAARGELVRTMSQSVATQLFRADASKVLLPKLEEIVASRSQFAAANALEVMRSVCTADSVQALCRNSEPERQPSAALRLVAASGIPASLARTPLNEAQATIVIRTLLQSIRSESSWMAASYDFQGLFTLATAKGIPAPAQQAARKAQADALTSLAERAAKGGDDAVLVQALWRSLGVVLQQQVALTPAAELAAMSKALSPTLTKVIEMGKQPPKGAGATDADFRETAKVAESLKKILARNPSGARRA